MKAPLRFTLTVFQSDLVESKTGSVCVPRQKPSAAAVGVSLTLLPVQGTTEQGSVQHVCEGLGGHAGPRQQQVGLSGTSGQLVDILTASAEHSHHPAYSIWACHKKPPETCWRDSQQRSGLGKSVQVVGFPEGMPDSAGSREQGPRWPGSSSRGQTG